MARVYNKVGSLTAVMNELHRHAIHEFTTIEQIVLFTSRIEQERARIYGRVKEGLLKEKAQLPAIISESRRSLEKVKADTIESLMAQQADLELKCAEILARDAGLFGTIWNWVDRQIIEMKIRKAKVRFNTRLADATTIYEADLISKDERLGRLTRSFEGVLEESCEPELYELNRRKAVIDSLSNQIHGAIGELKVENALRNLSDNSIIINDFSISFDKPLYFKQENQYIYSVQVDHLLITHAGVFVIETKNWSEYSVRSRDMFFPVNQVRRAGYVLYVMLSDPETVLGRRHLWGKQRIPVRNLIVFTAHKPTNEFQFVKILSLNQLEGYINYFKPIYSPEDTLRIAEFFIR
jgi:hypothetical protein